jgi:predicted enzyme related to lactoylglutathione lyase
MGVLRCVCNIAASSEADTRTVAQFYRELFGLDVVMDQGWIITLSSGQQAPAQISVACQGGSGQPVPPLTIEVDDLDEVVTKAQTMGLQLRYGPVAEPWGVRRLFVCDPAGTLINVMCHPPAKQE